MVRAFSAFLVFVIVLVGTAAAEAQDEQTFVVVQDKEQLKTIVPESFYFAGLSGFTQRRNSAVGKLGEKRFIVAGLVDVSGYSTDISGVYEGFFITDSDIRFGDTTLPLGSDGFGFSKDQKVNLFDLSGKKIMSVTTTKDTELRRPRPLMMVAEEDGIRFYKGRDFIKVRP